MGYQNMTRAEYETLRQQLGDKEMSDLVATFKTNVDGQPVTMPLPPAISPQTPTGAPTMNTPMQLPVPGQQLPVSGLAQAAQAVQTPAAAPMQTPGALTAATAQPMDELGSLRARVAEQEASARTRAEDRFAKQQEMIQTMYGGPTTSETLFALSRALLAPRQFTGFGSTLGKISGAFGDIDQQRRAAQQKRAEAQMLLQSSSADRIEGLEKDSLSNQIELAGIGARYEEALRKAGEAKYDLDPRSSAYKLRPGTGDNLGILTPEQAIVAAQDPRNKGKTFYTTDGRQRTLK